MKSIGARTLKKMLSALAALAALVLVILWMAGAFHAKIEPAQVERAVASLAPGQRVAEIHRVTENVVETVIGSIVAERKTTVSSKILATIQSIRVSAGSNVREGDLLIELDARSLSSQVQQARDSLSGAQAGLARAEADFKRMKDLMARNVISQSEYDQSQAAYRVAQAEVARASRAKEETEVALTYSQIRSPISGRVVDRLAEPGDTASPGRPLLTLYDPSALRLEAPVREGLATTLKVGDTLKGRIDALNLEVRGRIDEIVPQAETASRSLLVKVGIPRYPGVYTGLFGRLFIPVGRRQRICIPQAAITRIGQLEYVDVAAKDGTLERRFVQTGEHGEGGNVELLSGAQPGEKVVLKGSSTNSLEQHSRNQTEGD